MKKFLKQSKSVKLLVIGMIAAVCVAFIAEKKSAVQTIWSCRTILERKGLL